MQPDAPASPDPDFSPEAAAPPADALEAPPVAPPALSAAAPSADAPDANGAAFAALPLAVAGARVLLEQLTRLEAHEPGAGAGTDPEDVHRMRVATRRLRAALRVFRAAVVAARGPDLDLERATAELRALAAALGRVRDLDVFAAAIRAHARAAPAADRPALRALAAELKREKTDAQAALGAFLDGEAITYLRAGFHGALQAVAAGGPGRRREAVRRTAPRLIGRALRRLYAGAEGLVAPSADELHARRILAKRARYTCEYFAPAFGERLTGPIARLTEVQDTLGEIHDADVATGVLLGRIVTVAEDAARAPQAAPLARLVGRVLAARDARLVTFRAQWAALPDPRDLERALARPERPSRAAAPGAARPPRPARSAQWRQNRHQGGWARAAQRASRAAR
jgi:CHAD domain-containing protein